MPVVRGCQPDFNFEVNNLAYAIVAHGQLNPYKQ